MRRMESIDLIHGQLLMENQDWQGFRQLIQNRLDEKNPEADWIDRGLTVYLAAQLAIFGLDSSFLQDKRIQMCVDELVQHSMTPSRAICYEEAVSHHTSTLGLAYGALRNTNLFLKRDDIYKQLREIRAFVFQHLINGVSLASDTRKGQLRFDTLLACVPFGLFEPEDLVLVEAVNALYEKVMGPTVTDQERLLLAWYYVEQGSYQRSRDLLFACSKESTLYELVAKKLEKLGQLESRFILHRPAGNGNRYESCFEERTPLQPFADEEIVLQVTAIPLDKENPVVLVWNGEKIAGDLQDKGWRFKVPAQPAQKHCEYWFAFEDQPQVKTESFQIEIGVNRNLKSIESVQVEENAVVFEGDGIWFSLKETPGGLDWEIKECQPQKRRLLQGNEAFNLGVMRVEACLDPFSFTIFEGDEVRVQSAKRNAVSLQVVGAEIVGAELTLELNDEKIYGLGERYNSLNQRGEQIDQFVYNQYKGQGIRTYMPMPIAYTTGGFGFQIHTDRYSWIDCGKYDSQSLRLGTEANSMQGTLVTGAIRDQVRRLNRMNGPAEMVPEWALGPWMSSNNWDSEAEVRKQVELTKVHGIPATVLVIEAWSDEATFYIFNDATYEEKEDGGVFTYSDFNFPKWGRWPDPKGMMEYLHDNDLKCILWQIPVIKHISSLQHLQKRMDEAYFLKNGFGVSHPNGEAYRMPEGWFKDSLLMDFSNEAAKEWWFGQRQYLIDDLKVDGFKTDGGEFVFGYDLKFADGRTGREMRNAYPNDYVESYYRFAQQNGGITFSRAGYTGAQRFPAHWAGDERSTFGAFRRSLLAGLSAGLSGVIFWGWDLGGFSGDVPTAELFIRSTQMAAFCPIMQYHAESKAELNQDRTPWNIAERSGDERAISVYRYFANVRMSLLPYISQEANYAVETGEPLMRPLVLDYEEDPITHEIWDEYLFGRSLLVAPVVEEGARSRSVYLPEGRWFALFEETWLDGGRWVERDVPLDRIPVFVKEGTVLPLNMPESGVLGDEMSSKVNDYANLVERKFE